MATALTKRATVYFDPGLHHILRVKALETDQSLSDIINDALLHELAQDQEDFDTFKQRANEPSISFETLLKKLKADGKI